MPEFTEKLLALIAAIDAKPLPKKSRLAFQCAELIALLEESNDAPPEAFAAIPPALRSAAMMLLLATIAEWIAEDPEK